MLVALIGTLLIIINNLLCCPIELVLSLLPTALHVFTIYHRFLSYVTPLHISAFLSQGTTTY
jgi:hypothetical protein